ncbi:MAG: hypothetical protein OEY37_10855 [Gammaproteobacteria bacterium]|nr:hypothetical protein [Gammaproteobacteria bacterium]MDH5618183.1 hypothetical protein [Gammaproteobacteria bacterium]
MNCFSAFPKTPCRWTVLAAMALLMACGVPASESADRSNHREYSLHYTLAPDPQSSTVLVVLRLKQPRDLVREIAFAANAGITDVRGDGDLLIRDRQVRWRPPADGGTLEWRVLVRHERDDGAFDALLTADWGIFRAEDVIPRARTRTLKGAESRTALDIDLPAGWSVITEYSALDKPIVVQRPERRYDEPTGWLAMGHLGIRRETIAGTRVAIAAPQDQDVRRMEMLALLNWTLPELTEILPDALPRLTIVSAGAPMWRGGLSAPASFFIHADRPLISENATSPLLHEVMHATLGLRPRKGSDWIVEGLAEYYSIELLRRGRAITASRAKKAFALLEEWGAESGGLCGTASTAATTARAVGVFRDLDRELLKKSAGKVDLDTLLPVLVNTEIDLDRLAAAAGELIGSTPDTLHSDNLPGCRTMTATSQDQ